MTRPVRLPAGDSYVWFPEPIPAGAWIEMAACRGEDHSRWFPGQGDNITYRAAVEVCIGCPVRQDCLDYAVVNRVPCGIWGGLGERRRRALTRVTARAARPTPLHGSPGRYRAGCHCPECREAHRVEAARYREAAR